MSHLRGGAARHLAHRPAHFEIGGSRNLKTWLFTPPKLRKSFRWQEGNLTFVCWSSQQRKLGGAQQGSGESCNDICCSIAVTKPLLSSLSRQKPGPQEGGCWSQGHNVITPTPNTHPHLGWGLLRRSIFAYQFPQTIHYNASSRLVPVC